MELEKRNAEESERLRNVATPPYYDGRYQGGSRSRPIIMNKVAAQVGRNVAWNSRIDHQNDSFTIKR